ncbi:hypothetical protein BT69DRAFT_1348316 [Atractiella rhizophila]|nr:hypothetical protein BT69DRAFT_1348316 [Atractiella rhizophila]
MKRKRGEEQSSQDAGLPNKRTKPSISRLKANIRQAKRLLAKEGDSQAKTQHEANLKALEAELAAAQTAKTAEKNDDVYKGVRFFERQKLIRKIKHTKGEEELLRLRIDLNYVLNYPSERKYVSLFPSSIYVPHPSPLPEVLQHPPPIKCKDSDQVRTWVRAWVQDEMKKGNMSKEPEQNLDLKKKNTSDTDDNRKDNKEVDARELNLPEDDDFFD